jgi:hypothetical protein
VVGYAGQSFREKFKAYEIEVEQIKDLVSK